MRWRRAMVVGLAVCGVSFFILILAFPRSRPITFEIETPSTALTDEEKTLANAQVPTFGSNSSIHPVEQLIRRSQKEFFSLRSRQSRTLADAVTEYRKRYGIPPPPNFEKWFSFAQKRGVQLIDEYDTIYDNLLPFWAMTPLTIRERVREAIGREANALIALTIRGGAVGTIVGGPEWQRNVMLKMVQPFVQYLPDMDLAFNVHDEPRIVVPHGELSKMVKIAKDTQMPRAFVNKRPRNKFSRRTTDMGNGRNIKQYTFTRFSEYAHQHTWVPSRMSCHPDSPARSFKDNVPDNTTGYAFSAIGFIRNQTAFSDICQTPSLRTTFGLFDRPNAYKVSHELIPIFSQSKVSSYQDILYPSPWYYYGRTVTDQPSEMHQLQYNEALDKPWSEKFAKLWWRGTTTGGYSRDGGWRHQHRQHFLRKVNGPERAQVYTNKGSTNIPDWRVKDVTRSSYSNLIDVKFTGVGQCDEPDCIDQREFFQIAPPVNSQEAWDAKYLLDIDGNAFSGRFYAFLKSHSLIFKMAVFREWHQEWLWPWVHYVPLTLRGDDYLEAVRYIKEEKVGEVLAEEMAGKSREWAGKALRNEDMESWFFRLLLEYGRVIDDARGSIGFDV